MWIRDVDGDLFNVDTGAKISVEPFDCRAGTYHVRAEGPVVINDDHDESRVTSLFTGSEDDCRGAMTRLAFRLAALDLAQPAAPRTLAESLMASLGTPVNPPAPETDTEIIEVDEGPLAF